MDNRHWYDELNLPIKCDSYPWIIVHHGCLIGCNGLFACMVNQGSTVVTINDSHDSLLPGIIGDFAIMLKEVGPATINHHLLSWMSMYHH